MDKIYPLSKIGDLKYLENWLKKGKDPNVCIYEQPLAIHCVTCHHYESIKLLIQYKVNLNLTDIIGRFPLSLSCEYSNIKYIKLLLKGGADVNFQNKYGMTALHFASDYKTAKLLLRNGADPNIQNINGNTPLFWIMCMDYSQIIKLLLANGAKLKFNNNITRLKQHFPKYYANYVMWINKIYNCYLKQYFCMDLVGYIVSYV